MGGSQAVNELKFYELQRLALTGDLCMYSEKKDTRCVSQINGFQTIQKRSSNKKITNLDDYELELGNQKLEIKPCTKFLGIQLDSNIIFKTHILDVCRKLNYILFLMRSIRPYLDIPTMINIYYTFFYPNLIYAVEFFGHAANYHLNQIYLLQKSALRVILAIRPRNHVSSYFSEFKIMPIYLIFKYRFLMLFHRSRLGGEINVKLPLQNKITRSRAEICATTHQQQLQRGAVTADHRCKPVECTPHGRGGNWASRSAGAIDGFPVGVRFIADWVDCVPGSVAVDSSLRFLPIGWSPRQSQTI